MLTHEAGIRLHPASHAAIILDVLITVAWAAWISAELRAEVGTRASCYTRIEELWTGLMPLRTIGLAEEVSPLSQVMTLVSWGMRLILQVTLL